MCGRYVLPAVNDILANWPGAVTTLPPAPANYNVAPTQTILILALAGDGAWQLRPARWGLIPAWWNRPAPPALAFNARVEEAASKPMWRDSLRARRCLLPALGWYEWSQTERAETPAGQLTPQPYYFHSPAHPVLALAGLWAPPRATDTPLDTCAMLTTAAAPALAAIHHRMPIVLTPAQQAAWLDPATPPESLPDLLRESCTDLQTQCVSLRVNSVHHNTPDLITPVPPPQALF